MYVRVPHTWTIQEDFRRPTALEYASEELKNDKEIVLAAVTPSTYRERGWVAVYASEEMRKDKDIMMAAVTNHGRALEYASEELRDDKEIVLAAVKNNGNSDLYASIRLQGDKDIKQVAADTRRKSRACDDDWQGYCQGSYFK